MNGSVRDFVSNFPFPAFLLSAQPNIGNYGTSIAPVCTNAHFRRLVTGVENATEVRTKTSWMEALSTVETSRKFSLWLMPPPSDERQSNPSSSNDISNPATLGSTLDIELHPSWVAKEYLPIKLQLVKTLCRDYWAITSTPLSPLSPIQTAQTIEPSPALRRPASMGLRLPNFPPSPMNSHSSTRSTTPPSIDTSTVKMSPRHALDVHGIAPDVSSANFEMAASVYDLQVRQMLKEMRWEDTPLGPMSSWSPTLNSMGAYYTRMFHPTVFTQSKPLNVHPFSPFVVGIVMENPFPCSICQFKFLNTRAILHDVDVPCRKVQLRLLT